MFDGLLPRSARWAVGRDAAPRALAALGVEAVAVPFDARHAPVWPRDVVGSITECTGLMAAAVAWFDDIIAVGIDATPAVVLADDVVDVVATPVERDALEGPLAATVILSAKRSFAACWAALDGAVLELHDIEVALGDGTFVAVPAGGEPWSGRWAQRDGFVLTTIWRPNPGTPGDPAATKSSRGGPPVAP